MSIDASKISVASEQYSSQLWRLNNLYYIQDKNAKKVLFTLNYFQNRMYHEMWYLNAILKSRQFGFTTFIDIFALDSCIWNDNIQAGIIAHKLDDSEKIFSSKIAFPYDSLPDQIKNMCPIIREQAKMYTFANKSQISVSTSFRSGTLQILHISEYGKIAAQQPQKANEINTGAIEAVGKGQMIFVESTAEGRDGLYYDMMKEAEAVKDSGRELTDQDFKYFFFAWWENEEYQQERAVPIPQDMADYFKELEENEGIKLTKQQQWWYCQKAKRLGDNMKREYPATAKEAWEQSIEGSYYGKTMQKLRQKGRICRVPYDPALPVNTFWDIGFNDENAIWFFQRRGLDYRLIDYYENHSEGFAHYVTILKGKEYHYGTHYLPHDGKNGTVQTGKKNDALLREMGIRPITCMERPKNPEDVVNKINDTRLFLAKCRIDEEKCAVGIKHIEGYRKEWDERGATFKKTPFHDSHSNGADALRTGAMAMSYCSGGVSSQDLTPEDVADY